MTTETLSSDGAGAGSSTTIAAANSRSRCFNVAGKRSGHDQTESRSAKGMDGQSRTREPRLAASLIAPPPLATTAGASPTPARWSWSTPAVSGNAGRAEAPPQAFGIFDCFNPNCPNHTRSQGTGGGSGGNGGAIYNNGQAHDSRTRQISGNNADGAGSLTEDRRRPAGRFASERGSSRAEPAASAARAAASSTRAAARPTITNTTIWATMRAAAGPEAGKQCQR